MPTLIRLFVILLILVGLGYGAMFALVAMVKPNEKEVTVRIPARDLMPAPERDPLVQREIDTTRTPDSPAPADPAAPAAPAADAPPQQVPTSQQAPRDDVVTTMPPNPAVTAGADAPADDSSIVTLQPGVE